MLLRLYEFTCAGCPHHFTAPELVGGTAEQLMRSTGRGAEAVVRLLHDPAYAEVVYLLDALPGLTGLTTDQQRELANAVFSAACDPDVDGTPFVIGGSPRCPSCGSRTMTYWRPADPLELINLDLPQVGHERWYLLTGDQRAAVIAAAVANHPLAGSSYNLAS